MDKSKIKDIKLISKLNKDWRLDNIKIKKAGGQTNRNYVVEFKNKKYFVRLPWERKDIIDRKTEARNTLALNCNKKLKDILPKYYLYILDGKNILSPKRKKFNLPDGTMMTEYIRGRIFTTSLFKTKKYQVKLARMFYTFHTSGVNFVNKYNVFRDEIEKYRLAAKKYALQKLIDAKIIIKLEMIEKEAERMTLVLKKRVATHNDFLFQNFIVGDDAKMYLLDFEYAGMNGKGGILYDFAFLFADNLFRKPPINRDSFEKFLKVADKIYKQPLDRSQIYWPAIAAILVMFWWGLLRYFSVKTKKEKKYFKDYILKRAKGIKFLYDFINKPKNLSNKIRVSFH